MERQNKAEKCTGLENFFLSEEDEKSLNIYNGQSIPLLIFDKLLRVVWANDIFTEKFAREGEDILSGNIANLFENLRNVDKMKELRSSVDSLEMGYSWRGQVTGRRNAMQDFMANLLILPISARKKGAVPDLYFGIVDDVSTEFKSLLHHTFRSLLEASKLKDNDTGQHIERVSAFSTILAKALMKYDKYPELNDLYIENIGFLSTMHDVGKIGTPDDILNKEGPLNEWERGVMNEHTKNGAFILNSYPNPLAREIALSHHEQWDGNGYPYGLSEDMIPLGARIVSIADVYDALRSVRSYKTAWTHKAAVEYIVSEKGKKFDPFIVSVLIQSKEEFEKAYKDLKDEEGV